MSGPVLAALGAALLLFAALVAHLVRHAQLHFEIFYDRPRGEPEVLRFHVWLAPLFHFEVRRPPAPESKPGEPSSEVRWSEVLAKGWEAVREVRTVQKTLSSLVRHDLAFLDVGGRLRGRVQFLLRILESVPWRVDELTWVTRVGTGDPALTGMLSGLLWALKGTLFGVLAERMAFAAKPIIRVLPNFERVAFRTSFRCIVTVRLGDIIAAGAGVWRRKRGASWKTNTRSRA